MVFNKKRLLVETSAKTAISLLLILNVGCVATPSKAELRAKPDSYFENKGVFGRTRAENAEWQRRQYARQRQLDKEAACIFGTRPAIDRSKLGCDKVEGSPEYKALHGEN